MSHDACLMIGAELFLTFFAESRIVIFGVFIY